MLFLEAIHKDTYNLLQKITEFESFNHFALAGDTALALQYGHRISIDLDFFTTNEFDAENLHQILKKHFSISNVSTDKNALTANIIYNNTSIKVDFIRHNYPLITPPILKENLRLYQVKDIIAMKLNALKNRGAKKDFYGIFEILHHYKLNTMISYYLAKYDNVNLMMLIKSLTYFEDADAEPTLISLNKASWYDIKLFINTTTQKYINAQTQ